MEVGVGAMNKIILGDALEVLKDSPPDSVDLVCTDPPYGYSFMGKDWDKAVPSVEIWQECLRVLKPGAFCFVMSAPRSDVQMHMVQNLTEAGFRLDFTPIYWTYASGFPKAGNIGKMVDKRLGVEPTEIKKADLGMANNPQWNTLNNQHVMPPRQTDQAKALDGSYAGFQPKPAVEVIIVAMKPLSEKTFVDQALKNRKGITWLDDCRVPTGETDLNELNRQSQRPKNRSAFLASPTNEHTVATTSGRFPANLLISDDVLNDGAVTHSRIANRKPRKGNEIWGNGSGGTDKTQPQDSGSYSRYFDLDKWYKTLPFIITPKASKSEKNKGLEHLPTKEKAYDYGSIKKSEGRHGENTARANHHPTVKPLKLMSYLITLGSREKDIVLDPFVGSGTTCIAAKQLGRKYIGIEREAEYVEIAEARLKHTEKFKELKQVSLL